MRRVDKPRILRRRAKNQVHCRAGHRQYGAIAKAVEYDFQHPAVLSWAIEGGVWRRLRTLWPRRANAYAAGNRTTSEAALYFSAS
jgi:hypothetical protein